MQSKITKLLQIAIYIASKAIHLAEQNNLTNEQWFLDLETQLGYIACQDHEENVKLKNE